LAAAQKDAKLTGKPIPREIDFESFEVAVKLSLAFMVLQLAGASAQSAGKKHGRGQKMEDDEDDHGMGLPRDGVTAKRRKLESAEKMIGS